MRLLLFVNYSIWINSLRQNWHANYIIEIRVVDDYSDGSTYDERLSTVLSLLSQGSMHHVEPNELWIFWKEFGHIKLIFDLKLSKGKSLNENSSLWNFCCSYPEIRTSNLLIYMSYKEDTLSYLMIGTTKRSETFTINYSRRGFSLCKVSSRKSNVMSFPKKYRKNTISRY